MTNCKCTTAGAPASRRSRRLLSVEQDDMWEDAAEDFDLEMWEDTPAERMLAAHMAAASASSAIGSSMGGSGGGSMDGSGGGSMDGSAGFAGAPSAFYFDGTSCQCQPTGAAVCGPGQAIQTTGGKCMACASQKFKMFAGAQACGTCPNGSASNDITNPTKCMCDPILQSAKSPATRRLMSHTVKSGVFFDGSKCVNQAGCPIGSGWALNGRAHTVTQKYVCTVCATGKYQAAADATVPCADVTVCAAGKQAGAWAAGADTVCTDAPSAPDGIPAPAWAIIQLIINPTCSSTLVQNHTAIEFVYKHFILANRVEAPPCAFAQVMLFGLLAHSGGIATPKGRLGKAFFWGMLLCMLVQVLFTFASIASYIAAWASFSSGHAKCLMPWKHGHAYFNMIAFGTLGCHPQLLAYACVLMMYMLVHVEARRVWCIVNLNRAVGKFWVSFSVDWNWLGLENWLGFTSLLPLVAGLYTIFSFLVFIGSMSVFFSLAFLPVALASGAVLLATGGLMYGLRQVTRGEGRWPPVKALHGATSFFAFNEEGRSDAMGGLMVIPLTCTLCTLAISPLVAWGTPLALHFYAGSYTKDSYASSVEANNALIKNVYSCAFQGFKHWDFALPLLELDAEKLWQALQDVLHWPELSWGPERLMQDAEGMLTLNALVGLLKSFMCAAAAGLAFCGFVAPNVPSNKVAGDENWTGFHAVVKLLGLSREAPPTILLLQGQTNHANKMGTYTLVSDESAPDGLALWKLAKQSRRIYKDTKEPISVFLYYVKERKEWHVGCGRNMHRSFKGETGSCWMFMTSKGTEVAPNLATGKWYASVDEDAHPSSFPAHYSRSFSNVSQSFSCTVPAALAAPVPANQLQTHLAS
jgi:hypothetical protein